MSTACASMPSPRCSTATTAAAANGSPTSTAAASISRRSTSCAISTPWSQERCAGAVVIAEESTAWPGVTQPVSELGLGFAYKWNMGWMHDTLHYMAHDPIYRQYHHDGLTFGLIYAFSERFILPLSHDEVVHGKGSLIGRMPGDRWQKFANLRAYFGFMWAHPGKKLLFMGGEIAQEREWNHDGEVDWFLLDDPNHAGMQRLVRDLNSLYRREPALHRARRERRGLPLGDRRRSRQLGLRLPAPGRARATRRSWSSAT